MCVFRIIIVETCYIRAAEWSYIHSIQQHCAVVLDAIRREWGSEEAFASFVRTQLPKLLAVSKRRYSQQIASVATRAFLMAFGG